MKKRQIWEIWTNTDLTEGRGREYVLNRAERLSTATRLARGKGVMGSNATIKKVSNIYYHEGQYYPEPVSVASMTEEDKEIELHGANKETVIEKALMLGLTEEEISLIT